MELVFLFFVLFILCISQNNSNQKLNFKISLFLLFLFSGFRVVSGHDDDSYIKIFNFVQSEPLNFFNYSQEPGFILIVKSLGLLFSYKSLFLFFSALSIFLLYKACKRYTGYAILPILIYFSHKYIHHDLNQIRQGIVSLVFLNIIDSKKLFSLKKIFLSTSIHVLSIFFIPAKYFLNIKFTSVYKYLLIFIICFLFSFFIKSENFIDLFFDSRVYTYLIDTRFNGSINLLKNINFYKTTLFIMFIFLNFKRYRRNINKFNILFNAYFFGYLMLILFRNIIIFSARLSSVFLITESFLIYLIYKQADKKNKPLLLFIIILFTSSQLYYNLFLTNNSPII
jgi:hypothetical protein